MYERYNFKEQNGRIAQVTEFNTRMTYVRDDGRIAVGATVKSRAKYWFYQKTAPVRHYVGVTRMLRDMALR